MKLFSITSLGEKAAAALVECINDAEAELHQSARRVLDHTEKNKVPKLRVGFAFVVNLNDGGVVFELRGNTRWRVESEATLEQTEFTFQEAIIRADHAQ